jgi:hypothetical protein
VPGRASARSDSYDPATSFTMRTVPEVHRKSCRTGSSRIDQHLFSA